MSESYLSQARMVIAMGVPNIRKGRGERSKGLVYKELAKLELDPGVLKAVRKSSWKMTLLQILATGG